MPGMPNARLVPEGWEAHHAPVAEGGMTAECVVTRPASSAGTPTFDEEAGRTTYPAQPKIYTGPCRVQRAALTGANADVIGDRPQPLRSYVVSTPLAAPLLQVNDVVTLTTAVDPVMAGRRMRVEDVRGGSIVWQRDYLCQEWTPTTR